MKLVKKVAVIFDRTNDSLMFLAVLVLVFIMLSVTTEVVMRYFLGRPLIWVVDFSQYGLVWITFLGAAWVLRRERHVIMDIVTSRLNPRGQAILNIITSIICAIICLVIVWYGIEITWLRFQEGIYLYEYFEVLDGYILLIIPVGTFLLFIQFLRRINGYLKVWRGVRKPAAKVVEEIAGY